ncbi:MULTISPECIES: hypothetical protein [unclassified Mesorhizobium]|uniref:hypothetical protein n=1 Tax=unclassified Mesorhizobium TaxID=325217 RepID=UPI000FD6FDCE|nr:MULTISPECIES: hypothetical protein [unclassified Mesorhizobium]TGR37712.1 hypothetical protein EN842_48815 [bacterium M00.F.Ca.ET.199.01.1.1]TGU22694.1 hypothetical protein EN799_51370 [bacterium M00.F.Ca.ET.156.01.1.1]TGV82904.1 hypothetical protein EN792_028210 [Mesorhizobium sp. M00.F.Ca.ET.149.01.1.1]TGR17796.1 hypothetical protein EN845_28945 [Mesorhizobium sp. M8A.F.Ca.ET.202.01.1.1]TGR19796.1 hypothetical protein EN840_28775 [Mesorhizobium sp. M8A.F.Ca.ET.197.01.1.1]
MNAAVKESIFASILICLALVSAGISSQHFSTIWQLDASKEAAIPISSVPNDALDLEPGESQLGYVKRITETVHNATGHCEPTSYQLSVLEQMVVRLSGGPDAFATEGVLVKDRFTCGFCHQRAFLVHQALQQNGIDSEVFGLTGHVVVRALIEGNQYFTDPDYGVGPFPAMAEMLAGNVRSSYNSFGNVDELVGYYTTPNDNEAYGGLDSVFEQQSTIVHTASDAAKLLLGLSMLCLSVCALVTRRKASMFLNRKSF